MTTNEALAHHQRILEQTEQAIEEARRRHERTAALLGLISAERTQSAHSQLWTRAGRMVALQARAGSLLARNAQSLVDLHVTRDICLVRIRSLEAEILARHA